MFDLIVGSIILVVMVFMVHGAMLIVGDRQRAFLEKKRRSDESNN
tara:strand:+ start:733 stop:867 length:135 start_codon:yes stop_codon:yes gene_type:complete